MTWGQSLAKPTMNRQFSVCPPVEVAGRDLADWLELAAFLSQRGAARTADVNLGDEVAEDFEPVDLDEENELRDRRRLSALAAIEERGRTMNGDYPFRVTDNGEELRLALEWGAGGTAYLLCLVLSQSVGDGLLAPDLRPDMKGAPDLFQVCATACAAGICRGPSFSLGWPRLDSSRFLEKLGQIYGSFGDGRPRNSIPTGAPKLVKDDGIDVVAWSKEPDSLCGKQYLLGQAATGNNWRSKSIRDAIEAFHKTWFEEEPASKAIPHLFIPFIPHASNANPADFESEEKQDEERMKFRILTATYGHIYYRYRIPPRVRMAVEYAADGIGPIERLDGLASVQSWLAAYRGEFQSPTSP